MNRSRRAMPGGIAAGLLACGLAWASDLGKAIVEGNAILATVPLSDQFGIFTSALPDINGDGIEDLVVGATVLNPPNGDVAVRSGASGAKLFDIAPLGSTQTFADALEAIGDVDRDGTHDIAIGTTTQPATGSRGTVRMYSGDDGHLLWTVNGTATLQRFGREIETAGDFDRDGRADLLVGAPTADQNRGRAYLLSGLDGRVLRNIEAPAGALTFGSSIANLLDVDGDRIDDYAIGAPATDSQATRNVYVFSGAGGGLLRTIAGPATAVAFGSHIGSAGDFDCDGSGDFYVGDASDGGTAQGGGPGRYAVYSARTGALLFERRGTAPGEAVGRGGGSADYDGDGCTDVLVGAAPGAATNAGNLTLHGGPDGRFMARFTSNIQNEQFGFRSAALADLNGDGRLDLLGTPFGAPVPVVTLVAGGVARGAPLVEPAPGHSGIWVDPEHDGEGFVFEMLGNGLAGTYYFTYDRDGVQRYFVGLGHIVGRRVVIPELLLSTGGRLGGGFDPAAIVRSDEAQLVLSFDGCDSGWANYTIDGVAAEQRLIRLPDQLDRDCTPAPAPLRADFSGSWYDPARSGEGWVFQPVAPGVYAIAWFTFEASGGRQQWFTMVATQSGATVVAAGVTRASGGRFGRYFDPAQVARTRWGSLSMTLVDCNTATVTYDGIGASGTQTLTRLTHLSGVSCGATP